MRNSHHDSQLLRSIDAKAIAGHVLLNRTAQRHPSHIYAEPVCRKRKRSKNQKEEKIPQGEAISECADIYRQSRAAFGPLDDWYRKFPIFLSGLQEKISASTILMIFHPDFLFSVYQLGRAVGCNEAGDGRHLIFVTDC